MSCTCKCNGVSIPVPYIPVFCMDCLAIIYSLYIANTIHMEHVTPTHSQWSYIIGGKEIRIAWNNKTVVEYLKKHG